MSQSPPIEATEQVVGGRYSFTGADVLGTGGLAIVYRGRDLKLRREVAIKALRPEYLDSAESRRRFRQEARMLRFAEHPNFATIYDHIDQANGSWIVMELVPGRNLKQIVEQDGPLEVGEVVRILLQLAGALGHLHSRGVVHLDLKPHNIVLTADNVPKLIDFGVAQSSDQAQERVDGHAFGTAAYLAPEQAKGERVDRRTDIYALGCVIYELLTGRPPFVAPDGPNQKQEVIQKQIGTVPAAPSTYRSDLPAWVDNVVLRAIAKSPGQRYQSVDAFAAAAIAGLEERPVVGEREPTSRIPGRSTPGAVSDPAEPPIDPEPGQPSRRYRAWASGGRAARRTRPIRGTIWRITAALAIGNLILLAAILYRHGGIAAFEPVFGTSAVTTTTVTTDWLNVRDDPGVDATVVAILGHGVETVISGMPKHTDDAWWWPVTVESEQGTIDGWVWEDGVAVSTAMQIIAAPSRAMSYVQDLGDTARGWLPFGAIGPAISWLWPL